jgi:hypothetical protein
MLTEHDPLPLDYLGHGSLRPYTLGCSRILVTMDQGQTIEKARQFARTRYTGEVENIVREHEQKIAQMRNQLSARGLLMSGAMIQETARIDGEQIRAITEARLDAILEGYELYGIPIDEQMAINICDEIVQGMKQLIHNCKCPIAICVDRGSVF